MHPRIYFMCVRIAIINSIGSTRSKDDGVSGGRETLGVIYALGIPNLSSDLPTDRIALGNTWSTGNIVSMGRHIVVERLSCNATAISSSGTFVRAVLNEAVVSFPSCHDGPGYSCSLGNHSRTTALDYQNGSILYQESYTTV